MFRCRWGNDNRNDATVTSANNDNEQYIWICMDTTKWQRSTRRTPSIDVRKKALKSRNVRRIQGLTAKEFCLRLQLWCCYVTNTTHFLSHRTYWFWAAAKRSRKTCTTYFERCQAPLIATTCDGRGQTSCWFQLKCITTINSTAPTPSRIWVNCEQGDFNKCAWLWTLDKCRSFPVENYGMFSSADSSLCCEHRPSMVCIFLLDVWLTLSLD